MYRLQGATHFIFYNHTVGPDVESILNRYKELGIVSTLSWDLPLKSKKDIRTEAIFTAINDCNMRAAWLFKYLGEYEFFESMQCLNLNHFKKQISSSTCIITLGK